MKELIKPATRVSPARNSVGRSRSPITFHYPAAPKVKACSPRRAATEGGSLFTVLLLALCSFALCSALQAVTPAPDGGYPNRTTAEGENALFNLTTGIDNTALGFAALWHNTTGNYNTATGEQTLYNNIKGDYNTASGYRALYSNTGSFNTASGFRALYFNTGGGNTADGFQALYNNTTAISNTAVGFDALYHNTTGEGNVAVGDGALYSNVTGASNIAVGVGAGNSVVTANNVIAIGALGANVNNSCFIGHIRGVQTANADAIPVLIDSAGQLGTQSSSRRFKSQIKPMDKASESLLALEPVTFRYKNDSKGVPQFGLIAEEVAEVNPDLVVRDKGGEIYTVRYEAVNAMLLNEFLKAHRTVHEQGRKAEEQERKVQDQEATVSQLKKGMEVLTAQLRKQAAIIQKVSAQLDAIKPAPQMVLNDQ
jgi:Chaperone of endosialidase